MSWCKGQETILIRCALPMTSTLTCRGHPAPGGDRQCRLYSVTSPPMVPSPLIMCVLVLWCDSGLLSAGNELRPQISFHMRQTGGTQVKGQFFFFSISQPDYTQCFLWMKRVQERSLWDVPDLWPFTSHDGPQLLLSYIGFSGCIKTKSAHHRTFDYF